MVLVHIPTRRGIPKHANCSCQPGVHTGRATQHLVVELIEASMGLGTKDPGHQSCHDCVGNSWTVQGIGLMVSGLQGKAGILATEPFPGTLFWKCSYNMKTDPKNANKGNLIPSFWLLFKEKFHTATSNFFQTLICHHQDTEDVSSLMTKFAASSPCCFLLYE